MDSLIDLPDFKCNIQETDDPVLCIKTYLKKVDNRFSGILSKDDVWCTFLYQMVYAQIQIFLQEKILDLHNDILKENMSFAPMLKNIVKLMDCLALMDVSDKSNSKWTKNCNEVILKIAEYYKELKIKGQVKKEDSNITRNVEKKIIKSEEVQINVLEIENLDAVEKIIELKTENVNAEGVQIEEENVQESKCTRKDENEIIEIEDVKTEQVQVKQSKCENLDTESNDDKKIIELKTEDMGAEEVRIEKENVQRLKTTRNDKEEHEDVETEEVRIEEVNVQDSKITRNDEKEIIKVEDVKTEEVQIKQSEIENLYAESNNENKIIELETKDMEAEEVRIEEENVQRSKTTINRQKESLDAQDNDEEKIIELERMNEDLEAEEVRIEEENVQDSKITRNDEKETIEVEDLKTEEVQIKELEIKYLDEKKILKVETEDVQIQEVNMEEVNPEMFNITRIKEVEDNVDDFDNVEIRRKSGTSKIPIERNSSFFDTRNMWERLSLTTNTKNIDDDIV